MKNSKKKALVILLSLLTLSSCSPTANEPIPQLPEQSNTSNSSSEVISYYQSKISKLEESILNIKQEYYIAEKKYQDEIGKLNEQLKNKNETAHEGPEMENVSLLPFSYILNGREATIVKYTGNSTSATIPSKLQGHTVTRIGEYAFNSDIESIIISEGIKEIDWFAFSGCTRLTEIYIPMSVTMINYGAFDYCPKTLVIKCKKGSYAEAYAKSYGLNCIAE